VLVWGGRNISTDSGNVYDPATGEWEHLPAAPGPPRSGAAAVWTGEEAIIWGGSTTDAPPGIDPGGIAWNPRTAAWRELPAAPHGLLHARPVAFGEDGVLFTGGERPGGDPADLWFDLRTEQWTEVPNTVRVLNVAWQGDRLLGTGPAPRPVDIEGAGTAARTGKVRSTWSVVAFDRSRLAWTEAAPSIEARWLALAVGTDDALTAVSVDTEVRGHVLGPDGWTEATEVAGGGSRINTTEPTAYPPVAVWIGDRLVLGGSGGLLAWDPANRRFAGMSDRHILTFGGTVVWTGEHVVSLTNQNTEGWVWTPAAIG
jgi:hypothetical protein